MKTAAKKVQPKTYERLPYDIEPVIGYPDTLQIYRTKTISNALEETIPHTITPAISVLLFILCPLC